MRLGYWANPHRKSDVRIYINDVPELGEKGKAFISSSGSGVKLTVTPQSAYQAVIEVLVMDQVLPSPEAIEELPLDHFVQYTRKPSAIPAMRAPRVGRPASRREEADGLDLASIPVPDPVCLRIDHREPEALFQAYDGLPNVQVERVDLGVGDIEINGQIIVERKRCQASGSKGAGRTDFEDSVTGKGKRLFFQSEKMRLEEGVIPVILLEGEPHEDASGMLIQQIDGMLSFLMVVQKLNVITTYSLHHTAYMLLKMAVHHRSGLGYEVALRGSKPKEPRKQLAFVLEGLPGVSANMAKRLADHFGSMRALVMASDEELSAVKGMGPKTIQQVATVLRGE